MLCDRPVGVLANESLAQWYSSGTRAPLQGAFREIWAGGAASGKVITEGRQFEVVRQTKCQD